MSRKLMTNQYRKEIAYAEMRSLWYIVNKLRRRRNGLYVGIKERNINPKSIWQRAPKIYSAPGARPVRARQQ